MNYVGICALLSSSFLIAGDSGIGMSHPSGSQRDYIDEAIRNYPPLPVPEAQWNKFRPYDTMPTPIQCDSFNTRESCRMSHIATMLCFCIIVYLWCREEEVAPTIINFYFDV